MPSTCGICTDCADYSRAFEAASCDYDHASIFDWRIWAVSEFAIHVISQARHQHNIRCRGGSDLEQRDIATVHCRWEPSALVPVSTGGLGALQHDSRIDDIAGWDVDRSVPLLRFPRHRYALETQCVHVDCDSH